MDVRRPSESVRPSVTKRCSSCTVFSAIRDVFGNICDENADEALLTKRLFYTAGESPSQVAAASNATSSGNAGPKFHDNAGTSDRQRRKSEGKNQSRANCAQCSALSKTLWLCLDWASSTAARNHELVRKRRDKVPTLSAWLDQCSENAGIVHGTDESGCPSSAYQIDVSLAVSAITITVPAEIKKKE